MSVKNCCADASEFLNKWVIPCEKDSEKFDGKQPIKILCTYPTAEALKVVCKNTDGITKIYDSEELGQVKEPGIMVSAPIAANAFFNSRSKIKKVLEKVFPNIKGSISDNRFRIKHSAFSGVFNGFY